MDNIRQNLILIVDDSPTNIKVLFELLQESGFRVLVAKSGESAIDKLQAVKPDLILLDVMMPGIDGFEVCRRLKAAKDTQDLPIIFMTALSDAIDKVKGLSLGAVDYITKPFQHEEVLARVDVHLKLYRLNKELEQRVAERTAALTIALEQLQRSQLQLVQSEKMSALGQLIAGIAHEINNPLNFLKNNFTYVEKHVRDLLDYVQICQQMAQPELAEYAAKVDIEYLLSDLPEILISMKKGAERIENISVSLRAFSRANSTAKVPFDIHEAIDSTLLILQHRLKGSDKHPEIEVIKEYADLPLVECFPEQLSQVFMNLLANAIDALEERNEGRSFEEIERDPNRIMLQTKLIESNAQPEKRVLICIKDNGVGIPEDVKPKIFDYLFTTKPVGKGTGLGLSIVRQIVVEKHGGTLEVASDSQGCEFLITLSVKASDSFPPQE